MLVTVLLVAMGMGGCAQPGVSGAGPHGCSRPFASSPDADRFPSTVKAGPTAAPMPAPKFSEDQPAQVFDDFSGPAGHPPDSAKWTVVAGTGWDGGIQDYGAEGAVLDGQGHLALRADKTDDGYTSGRVETRQRASFGYGILITRIKMPSGMGLWPSYWLIGADEDVNPWPGSGEIDMVEMVSDPRKHYTSLHGPITGVKDYLQRQIVGEGEDLSQDFHDYWVIHKKDEITVGMDDKTWGTFTPKSLPPSARWVYNKQFCLILNLSVGGAWAGAPDESTKFPATMLVDWVHWKPAT